PFLFFSISIFSSQIQEHSGKYPCNTVRCDSLHSFFLPFVMAQAILSIPVLSAVITTTTVKLSKSLLNSSLLHGYGRGICCCSSAVTVSQQQQRQPQVRSPQLVALEYADLSIPHIVSEELGATRVRQHVNPLSSTLSIPVEVPNWNDVFEHPKLPLVVDIGSGSGRFLMWLAKRNPGSKNYMGLDIRKKLVTRAEKWAKELALSNMKQATAADMGQLNSVLGLKLDPLGQEVRGRSMCYSSMRKRSQMTMWNFQKRNQQKRKTATKPPATSLFEHPVATVHRRRCRWSRGRKETVNEGIEFVFDDARTFSLRKCLNFLQGAHFNIPWAFDVGFNIGSCIPCPDPHFKKRHHKRRIVQKPLVEAIVSGLMPGGQVFIQSDVFEVAVDMRKYFDAESEKLVHIDSVDSNLVCDSEGWLVSNPMGIRTEREIHAEYEGAKIYRRMYQKPS
ncbi:tRNA (guanine-N-7) methyltransferase, partial [Cynara cardunculus var. scolymus]